MEMQSRMPVSGGDWLSSLSQGCGSQELTALQQATEDQSDTAEEGERRAAAFGPQPSWTTLCFWACLSGQCVCHGALSGVAARELDRPS